MSKVDRTQEKGYYILSSSEREQERIASIRKTRLERLLQVRKQEKLLSRAQSKLRAEKIQNAEDTLLKKEESKWQQERNSNLEYLDVLLGHLKANVGEGHKRAEDTLSQRRKKEKKLRKQNDMLEKVTQRRHEEALEILQREKRQAIAAFSQFKQRQKEVKATEHQRAIDRISQYYESKEQKEREILQKQKELLRLLSAGGGTRNYKNSHVHELGTQLYVEKHSSTDLGASLLADMINRENEEKKLELAKERKKAALRERERTHAAAEIVRAKEEGKEVEKQLLSMWITERQAKVEDILSDTQQREAALKESSRQRRMEKEVERLFNNDISKPDKSYSNKEETDDMQWTHILSKAEEREKAPKPWNVRLPTEVARKPLKSKGKSVVTRESLHNTNLDKDQSIPGKSSRNQLHVDLATVLKRDNIRMKQKSITEKYRVPVPKLKSTVSKGKKPGAKKKSKKVPDKTESKSFVDIKSLLEPSSTQMIENYLNEKDPLDLKKIADDVSDLTSSVLTDVSQLIVPDLNFIDQSDRIFSETSASVENRDMFSLGTSILSDKKEKTVRGLPFASTSTDTSSPFNATSSDSKISTINTTIKDLLDRLPADSGLSSLKEAADALSDSSSSLSVPTLSDQGSTPASNKRSIKTDTSESGDFQEKVSTAYSSSTITSSPSSTTSSSGSASPKEAKDINIASLTKTISSGISQESSEDDLIDDFLETLN